MTSDLSTILGGFGVSDPSWFSIPAAAGSGAATGAMASGGNPYVMLGTAAIEAIGGYFDYKAAKEQAKAAMELAETQLATVQAAQKLAGKMPSYTAPAYTMPLTQQVTPQAAQTMVYGAPTTVSTLGRSFFSPGDTPMASVLDPFLQQIGLGSLVTQPTGTVTQPVGVQTTATGLPVLGAGGLSPAGLFTAGAQTVRPIRELNQQHPVTGKIHVWRHMGRPVLYSGDLAACRRVNRVAKRVAKAIPRRRGSP